jgi:hypothetical protein
MAEPDNLVLEILKEIRREMADGFRQVNGAIGALTDRSDDLETKLDGLTHAVIAGFGSLVHELDDIKTRVSRLERERA